MKNANAVSYVVGSCFALFSIYVLATDTNILTPMAFTNFATYLLIAIGLFVRKNPLVALGCLCGILEYIIYITMESAGIEIEYRVAVTLPSIIFWSLLLLACCIPRKAKKIGMIAAVIQSLNIIFSVLALLLDQTHIGLFKDLFCFVGAIALGVALEKMAVPMNDNGMTEKNSIEFVLPKFNIANKNNEQTSVNAYEELERIAKLHDQGALDDDEFNTMKSKLMGKM